MVVDFTKGLTLKGMFNCTLNIATNNYIEKAFVNPHWEIEEAKGTQVQTLRQVFQPTG
jgi:hypothetical protein